MPTVKIVLFVWTLSYLHCCSKGLYTANCERGRASVRGKCSELVKRFLFSACVLLCGRETLFKQMCFLKCTNVTCISCKRVESCKLSWKKNVDFCSQVTLSLKVGRRQKNLATPTLPPVCPNILVLSHIIQG